jgi:hypothetical protein
METVLAMIQPVETKHYWYRFPVYRRLPDFSSPKAHICLPMGRALMVGMQPMRRRA